MDASASRTAPRDEWYEPEADAWADPIDFLADDRMTGAPELRQEHIPECLFDFAHDTAERMGVDPCAVALAALVTSASVLTDEWRLQPKRLDYTWTEQPRIWGAIVGDPSILKTPVLKACTAPVDMLEIQARKRHEGAMVRYRAELAEWKKSKEGDEPKHPVLDRFLVESLTIEALSEVLRDDFAATMRAPAAKVLVRQDEMGEFFGNLDRYNAGGKGGGDRGAYLRLYNGGRYTTDRIMRGNFAIPNWSACFLGGIQPGPIQRIAKAADDDGLLQRFIYCVPAHQGRGEDRRPNADALKRYQALFPAMVALEPAKSVLSPAEPDTVKLHAEAHAEREALDTLTTALSAMPDTSPRLRSAYGKFPGLYARICLLFHLIEIADCRARGVESSPLTVVQPATARRAAAYLRDIVLPHLMRADALMYLSTATGHARWIAGFVLAKGMDRIASRDVVQNYHLLRDVTQRRELQEAMEGLVLLGWLKAEEPSNPSRPIASWQVNPKVHTVFAAQAAAERQRRKAAQQATAEAIRAREQFRHDDAH